MVGWKIANSMIFPFKCLFLPDSPDGHVQCLPEGSGEYLRSETHLGCLKILYPFISYMAYKSIGFPSFSLYKWPYKMSKNVQIPRSRKHQDWWPTWKWRLVAWEVGTCQHLRAGFAMMRAYCIQKMSKVLQKYA